MMTKEEKELLLKDLCARLPYNIKADGYPWIKCEYINSISKDRVNIQGTVIQIENVKPYLRPMSSMTEEELDLYRTLKWTKLEHEVVDWLNASHFDYRGLIQMGLAIEAPEDMYKL